MIHREVSANRTSSEFRNLAVNVASFSFLPVKKIHEYVGSGLKISQRLR